MSKKRTKKQKSQALHQFTVSWKPKNFSHKRSQDKLSVNSQLNEPEKNIETKFSQTNFAEILGKNGSSASIKKEIVKSLILATFILASEIVIYLNWTKILSFGFGF